MRVVRTPVARLSCRRHGPITRGGHPLELSSARGPARMPASFLLLLAPQFASALADNALLIVTIDLLQQRALPGWLAPLLKVAFIAAYVVLAPFVGPLADAVPKARLMAWMNGIK